MRPGFNPTRRNRNIGTTRQGHGQDNRLVIPAVCHAERRWNEQLGPHQWMQRVVAGREVVFLVEETRAGCAHACTVDDICHVLANIPAADWRDLDTFVLRQPSRKQAILQPAWGRMYYFACLGPPSHGDLRQGPAVMIEAADCSRPIEWDLSLRPEDQAELERLRQDGHAISRDGRRHLIAPTPRSVRATQLYRTLLHEIGHWVDFLEKVEGPSDREEADYGDLLDAYYRRPSAEREAYAHRYADAMREKLFRSGVFPFEPRSHPRAKPASPRLAP